MGEERERVIVETISTSDMRICNDTSSSYYETDRPDI